MSLLASDLATGTRANRRPEWDRLTILTIITIILRTIQAPQGYHVWEGTSGIKYYCRAISPEIK